MYILQRNISIISLNVSWNGFYLDGCRALMSALRSNKILEKLDLTCNRIDFECVQQLIKGINGNTTVTSLNVSRCMWSRNCPGCLKPFTLAVGRCIFRVQQWKIDWKYSKIVDFGWSWSLKHECIVRFLGELHLQ